MLIRHVMKKMIYNTILICTTFLLENNRLCSAGRSISVVKQCYLQRSERLTQLKNLSTSFSSLAKVHWRHTEQRQEKTLLFLLLMALKEPVERCSDLLKWRKVPSPMPRWVACSPMEALHLIHWHPRPCPYILEEKVLIIYPNKPEGDSFYVRQPSGTAEETWEFQQDAALGK